MPEFNHSIWMNNNYRVGRASNLKPNEFKAVVFPYQAHFIGRNINISYSGRRIGHCFNCLRPKILPGFYLYIVTQNCRALNRGRNYRGRRNGLGWCLCLRRWRAGRKDYEQKSRKDQRADHSSLSEYPHSISASARMAKWPPFVETTPTAVF